MLQKTKKIKIKKKGKLEIVYMKMTPHYLSQCNKAGGSNQMEKVGLIAVLTTWKNWSS